MAAWARQSPMVPGINTPEVQMEIAAGKSPSELLRAYEGGVGIQEGAWVQAVTVTPRFYLELPFALKTPLVSAAALEGDARLFPKVPDRHRTDAAELKFRQAVAAEEVAEAVAVQAAAAEEVAIDLTSDALSEGGTEPDEYPPSDPRRPAGLPNPKRARPNPARRRPLAHYSARLSSAPVEGFVDAPEDEGHAEHLHRAGNILSKLYSLSQDPSATPAERARAQEKLDQKLRDADSDVVRAYQGLASAPGGAKVGAAEVDVLSAGSPLRQRNAWLMDLASACAAALLVGTYSSSGPVTVGFYGDRNGARAAAALFVDVVCWVAQAAENTDWARGFASKYLCIQQGLKAAAKQAANTETALVVVDKDALIGRAEAALGLRSVHTSVAHARPTAAYLRGSAAAEAYSRPAAIA